MSKSDNSAASPPTERDRLERRIRELSRVLEDVEIEQMMAIYRASRIGVPTSLIARWSLKTADKVEELVADLSTDPDNEDYEEGPRWIATWPGSGWVSGPCLTWS
ncbi:hypothetical protein [Fodinicola acaciae]|uniref:hypothetical protein n=1 Tax=Fodinicola acaciae TaxID=2681555 RepID=UPI0013CF823E|nr:hypothetical protein [Fodinicola acaciae]